MNNWEKQEKKANGNYENLISRYFSGDATGEKLDKIADILLKQSSQGGGGRRGNGGVGYSVFSQEFLTKMVAVMGGTLIAAFAGFTWLRGEFQTMMNEASPYAKEKAVIEVKQQEQDERIKEQEIEIKEQDEGLKELNRKLLELDVQVTGLQQLIKEGKNRGGQ